KQGVRGKDGAVLLAELLADGFLIGTRVGDGFAQGMAQTFDFVARLGLVDEAARNADAFGVDDKGRTDGDARRNGNASFDFHGVMGVPPIWLLVVTWMFRRRGIRPLSASFPLPHRSCARR